MIKLIKGHLKTATKEMNQRKRDMMQPFPTEHSVEIHKLTSKHCKFKSHIFT